MTFNVFTDSNIFCNRCPNKSTKNNRKANLATNLSWISILREIYPDCQEFLERKHGYRNDKKKQRKKGHEIDEESVLKGCVRYICASLFFKPKRKYLSNCEKCFLFHFKSAFRSRENQILDFYISDFMTS